MGVRTFGLLSHNIREALELLTQHLHRGNNDHSGSGCSCGGTRTLRKSAERGLIRTAAVLEETFWVVGVLSCGILPLGSKGLNQGCTNF